MKMIGECLVYVEEKQELFLTSLPVNRQGDNTGTASPSYSKETPLKWDLAKPTNSSWFTPVDEAYFTNIKPRHSTAQWPSGSHHLVLIIDVSWSGPTSCSGQHHPWGFVMAVDVIHQVLTAQFPDGIKYKQQNYFLAAMLTFWSVFQVQYRIYFIFLL